MKFPLKEFNKRFPDDNACLEELMQKRFGTEFDCPKCKKQSKFYRIKSKPVYSCMYCRYQVSPTAGTIFHKSSTPLTDWFYAMYLMTQTRAGISAKQLERELGCTYKTAWRIFHQIRSLMAEDGGGLLKGTVEIDETYIGGYKKGMSGLSKGGKSPVIGMVERGGRVRTKVLKDPARFGNVMPPITKNIAPATRVITDQAMFYKGIKRFYPHDTIHHDLKIYVRGDVYTNTIEGFWSIMKLGIRGVYRHVDPKYLQAYADEYAWRYSNRHSDAPMFELLLKRITM